MKQFEDLNINEGVENITELYNKIAVNTEKLVYESYREADKEVSFPVDINIIAEYLNIEISKDNLNLAGATNYSRKLAIITARKGKGNIVVDENVSYKTRRYAIANGIGRCLMNRSGVIFKSSYAIPLIPQSLEEIAADSIAVFLLMPITIFKDEFLTYLNACENRPLDVDVWVQHLSDRCQISQFNLAIGYQQMKQVLCYQRQQEFEKYDYDINKMPDEDKYSKIFA